MIKEVVRLIGVIGIVVILTGSFWITEKFVKLFNRKLVNYAVIYIWGVLLLLTSLVIEHNFVFSLPTLNKQIILVSLVIFIVSFFIAKQSGYRPVGTYNIINFTIFYPLFEEVAFRGLILPLLNPFFSVEIIEIAYAPVTLAVVISAVLFAVAHLQYYQLNAESIRFMIFACIGGIVFGAIANETNSIIIPLILHIGFNSFAALSSIRKN